MFNLATLLEDSARAVPDKTALVCGDVCLTYAEVNDFAERTAAAISALGINRGDKIALSCPNIWYFPIIYYGILKAGAVVVPLNIMLKSREIAYHLADSDARAYFCFEGTSDLPIGEYG